MPILATETTIYPENLLDEVATSPSDRQWWAIYTKSRQEKALARQMLRSGIPFYLPLIAKENLIRGRRVHSHVPLFGGYVFLFGTDQERVQCLTTNRISRILPVVDAEQLRADLLNIRLLIDSDAPLTVERRLLPGERVRIKGGSMMGLEGVVLTHWGRTRLLVAVSFLQQGVSVEIDGFLLEPIG